MAIKLNNEYLEIKLEELEKFKNKLKYTEPEEMEFIDMLNKRITEIESEIKEINKQREYFLNLKYPEMYKIGLITKKQMGGALKINKEDIFISL